MIYSQLLHMSSVLHATNTPRHFLLAMHQLVEVKASLGCVQHCQVDGFRTVQRQTGGEETRRRNMTLTLLPQLKFDFKAFRSQLFQEQLYLQVVRRDDLLERRLG